MSVCESAIKYEAGHEYVDLGLSVKWATCNVGAESPDGYGYRYSFGNNNTQGNDIVNRRWHSKWRMPTEEEFRELLDSCSFEWEEHEDVRGIRFISTKPGFEGISIFLRASGLFDIDDMGPYEYGMYWAKNQSKILFFEKGVSAKGEVTIVNHHHYPWACVRPVF